MIITQERKKVVQSHDFDSVNCTIDAEDMRYVASLLRNNYSNTRLAVVREVTANALDANLEANSDRQIEIKLPTKMNPTFAVRDFGGGLSQEDVFGLYSKYGKSTKRTSNNYIGAFGIGKFAPLSYGENFTCVSYNGGMKSSYNIFVNDDDDTKIVRLFEEPSNEPTGLSIEVAVSDDDISKFQEVVQDFFRFFSADEMPKFIGVEEDFIKATEYVLKDDNDEWFFLKDDKNYYNRTSHVIMGRVAYPLDRGSMSVENYIGNESKVNLINQLLTESNFYIRVPVGSVKLHHSRESLEYNKSTQKEICAQLLKASNSVQDIAKAKLADSEDLWDAKRNYAKVINALPYSIKRILENSFEWKGVSIESPMFQVEYKMQDNIRIQESSKIYDSNSRNGFKVQTKATTRAYCQDKSMFLIHDTDSSHGNNLRVRTLMNENSDLEVVYIITPLNKLGDAHMKQEWHFGKIDAKHIARTSIVEKEKVIKTKVSGSTSRANVALFKMNKSSRVHRNSDYWVNAEVNSDLDKVEGSIDGKLLYVPIKNSKIDHDRFELNDVQYKLINIVNCAEDNSQEKTIELFGVRTGDIKKLDKDVWVSFFDYYVDYSKNVIKKNKKESIIFADNRVYNGSTKLGKLGYNLGRILQNTNFKHELPKDHLVTICQNSWNTFQGNIDNVVREAYLYLSVSNQNWLDIHVKPSMTKDEVEDCFETLSKNYPCLEMMSQAVSSWGDLDELPIILDYITLCDKNREGEG
jgi:hypothetical protein